MQTQIRKNAILQRCGLLPLAALDRDDAAMLIRAARKDVNAVILKLEPNSRVVRGYLIVQNMDLSHAYRPVREILILKGELQS